MYGTHHHPSEVHPGPGDLELFLDGVVGLEGQVVILEEEGQVSQLSCLQLQGVVRIAVEREGGQSDIVVERLLVRCTCAILQGSHEYQVSSRLRIYGSKGL